MKDSLAQLDDTKSPAFLLRNNVNTEENRNLLNEHGYTELILYDNSLQAGMQENGKPYICYGFFKQPVLLRRLYFSSCYSIYHDACVV